MLLFRRPLRVFYILPAYITHVFREEDGRASNTSVSINLDRSRDSLLDHSVCSNPYDEISVLQKMTEDVPKAS